MNFAHSLRHRQRGVTLIELMVALLVGLFLTLAVYMVMSNFESRRRTNTAGSELDKAGALAMAQIDRQLRSAGSGFAQAASFAYGCALHASKSDQQILPAKDALAAPFASVDPGTLGVFRLAPALILPGQTTPGASGKASDVLVIMASAAAWGGVPAPFTEAAQAAALTLANTLPFSRNDLMLLSDEQPAEAGGVAPCLVTQVSSSATTGSATNALALAGTWYSATVDKTAVTGYSETGTATVLGNAGLGRLPEFVLMGVGDNNTLYTHDLLQTTDTPLQATAEGVFELHALYGIDTNTDKKVDLWVSPTDSKSGYGLSDLSDGSLAAAGKLRNIKAIRVGLILRTALPERDEVSSATVTLFNDINGLTHTRDLTSSERHYRYRTLESTIPLRNNFL
ncbi:PilW family protein [Hydrogenophaga taeniospiralis]|uniref:PilW family protein n=1 Tax=Hydrogenophaga taeniospiralis TaxID=65656 RepID=UPI001CFBEE13|nr:PilW family protein [Hydrogenophaga taeniospiralis]MCB4365662.1 PilW family protein [Hydrogenophaga taeniospiralis]